LRERHRDGHELLLASRENFAGGLAVHADEDVGAVGTGTL
jgi:hypothetical protein